jgi:hypothetical protein
VVRSCACYWQSAIVRHILAAKLVRWLSGRKQRFAKAPYPRRVPRVRIPPSPPRSRRGKPLAFAAPWAHVLEMRTCSTGGALRAFKAKLSSRSQREALDNLSLTASRCLMFGG